MVRIRTGAFCGAQGILTGGQLGGQGFQLVIIRQGQLHFGNFAAKLFLLRQQRLLRFQRFFQWSQLRSGFFLSGKAVVQRVLHTATGL